MTFYLDDDDELADIRYDNVFKAVFARKTPESLAALSHLISAIIGRPLTVKSVIANEPAIDNLRDRQIRFDIHAEAENGELVNVEMSLNPDAVEPVRLEFYGAKLFTGQDIRGTNYNELKAAYQIAILAKGRFFDDDSLVHCFEYYDPERHTSLGGRSRIVTLELMKAVVEKPVSEMGEDELWAVYLRYLTDRGKRGKINEVIAREEGIAMASKVLVTISKDEVERARLTSEFKYEMDTQSRIIEAERDGIRKGGKKRAIEIARKLKKRGLPIDEITEDTGLSPEEIAAL